MGVYDTTRCYGIVLDRQTEKPLANIRIVTTDHSKVDETVFSKADGTFEINVHVDKLSNDYYIQIEADTLFQSFEIKVNDLQLGQESYYLGKIYFEGAYLPKVSTGLPENITTVSATCAGSIEEFGYSAITERGFVYSTMQYPTVESNVIRVDDSEDQFSAELPLSPHTTYYVRAYAVNGMGVGYGNQVVVSTLDGLPAIETTAPSQISATNAVCGGLVFNDGGFPVTARGVCWSLSPSPTIANLHTSDGTDTGSFVSQLGGLHPGKTYYVRAYAQNEAGIAYGPNQVFTTLSGLPEVATTQVSNITATTALAGGTVVSDGGFPVLRRGICYSTSPNPTTSAAHTCDGAGLGDFVSQMTSLAPGTTYYFRSYATNGVGTVYGTQYLFVTE